MPEKPHPPAPDQIAELPRRGFMTRAAAFLAGAVVGLVPILTAAICFLDPLMRRKKAVGATGDAIDAEGFIKVTSLDALAVSDTPDTENPARLFKVVADRQDFWNKFPNSEIGAVYLRLRRGDSGDEIQCFNARCPHLGCTVNYVGQSQVYLCPCHESAFSLDGQRTNQIPPRDMDPLETKVDENGDVWVKYVKYRAGIEERVPV